jgi:hypothetical protein
VLAGNQTDGVEYIRRVTKIKLLHLPETYEARQIPEVSPPCLRSEKRAPLFLERGGGSYGADAEDGEHFRRD